MTETTPRLFEDYLDINEAAREIGMHPQTLRKLAKSEELPAVLFAGKYLIERDALELFRVRNNSHRGRNLEPGAGFLMRLDVDTDARVIKAVNLLDLNREEIIRECVRAGLAEVEARAQEAPDFR